MIKTIEITKNEYEELEKQKYSYIHKKKITFTSDCKYFQLLKEYKGEHIIQLINIDKKQFIPKKDKIETVYKYYKKSIFLDFMYGSLKVLEEKFKPLFKNNISCFTRQSYKGEDTINDAHPVLIDEAINLEDDEEIDEEDE